jgi:predicted Na+-dependent transporter
MSAGKFTLFPAGIAKKLAKGDTALSVTLTATSSLVCVFTIPWIVAFSMD